jgi:hypothetical protein
VLRVEADDALPGGDSGSLPTTTPCHACSSRKASSSTPNRSRPEHRTGPFLPGAADISPDTQRRVDDEVRRIVDEAHQQVLPLLQQNRSMLDALATALLEHETLDEDDAYAAAGVPRAATASTGAYATAARSRIDG